MSSSENEDMAGYESTAEEAQFVDGAQFIEEQSPRNTQAAPSTPREEHFSTARLADAVSNMRFGAHGVGFSVPGDSRAGETGEARQEGEEDDRPYKPVPMQDYDFSSEPDEHTDTPDWCFMCMMAHATADEDAGHNYSTMKNFIREHYEFMEFKTLVREIQYHYNVSIRPTLLPGGPVVWRKECIANHLHSHAPLIQLQYEDSLRTHNRVMLIQRQNGIFLKQEGTGREMIDARAYDLYLKAEKQRNSMLSRVKDFRTNLVL